MKDDERRQKRAQYDKKRNAQTTPEQREQNNTRRQLRRAARTPEQREDESKRRRQDRIKDVNVQEKEAARKRKIPPPSKYIGRHQTAHPTQLYLGLRTAECKYCSALHFQAEKNSRGKFSSCCERGTIALKKLTDYPTIFSLWLTENTEEGKHFRQNIRKYNNAFAFASFGYQPIKFTSGPQPVVIHGQVYHKTIQTSQQVAKPSYAQLYFLDPEYANQHRLTNDHNKECKEDFMMAIDCILRDINPFAKAFKMMGNLMKETNEPSHQVKMWITKDRNVDPRRYNLPVANEVAAIFVSEDGEPPFDRDIAVHPLEGNKLQYLSIISPNCDPMTYPLLFPQGESGWQPKLAKSSVSTIREGEVDGVENPKHVSMLEFYSYHLQERGEFNRLLHAGKLTQQYIIDAFLKVEGQPLTWNRLNQKKLRVDLYMGLMDYVNSQAEQKQLKAGRMVILPSSFTGGKRCMQQNYQDAMVLVAKFGKPDLFITFTCNPKWKEITDQLLPRETAMDRPDIVSVVFKLKLREFMNDMVSDKGEVLGKVKAYISVIEFQKRGLPHCHMLFIMNEEDKLREPEEVNTVVCAELPDESDTELFDIVKTCMLHGPCGGSYNNAPCMVEEKGIFQCSKNFPKAFSEQTIVNNDGYPLYRRRNNGKSANVRGTDLDNRWVVPYNPYLTRKYNAHINVEVCSSVKSVKYIFKYVYKGHDAAVVRVCEDTGTYNWDEVQCFLDTRYISSPEAMWRLRKYEMCDRSHAIELLPVHLPSQQTVIFEEGTEEQHLRRAEQAGTKLTKWFLLNQAYPEAKKYLYTEIPYHFVWFKGSWKQRKRGSEKILPRMYTVSLNDMERFCLRLLLLHVKGAESFESLRTINNVTHETFKQAAQALNLLEDDEEWMKAMNEAILFRMPKELRLLFSSILSHASPTQPKLLYERFRHELFEDFFQIYDERTSENMALKEIEDHLMQFGKRCKDFQLPTPDYTNCDLTQANLYSSKEEAEQLINMMNTEQRTAFDIIMNAVQGKPQGKCFFLSGAGGCGKTFVYRALVAMISSQKGIVKCVAPTGLAATLLKGGKTVHSGFGIHIYLDKNTVSRFKQGSKEWTELMETKLIIWDEISMCHVHLLNAVDRSLRDLLSSDEPFGGIPIVVGGDFRQQAPVVLHGTRVQVVESCVKSSPVWKQFFELKLSRNMRLNVEESTFAEWLLQIGKGANENEGDRDFIKLDETILSDDIVKSVYGVDINLLGPEELASRAVLCPKNEDTIKVNEKVLSLLHGELRTYYSVDSVGNCENDEERSQYPMEFLNSLTPMGMPPHCINLKKGCCVMLLRNLNTKYGLCNGTRLIVENLGTNVIECSIFSGENKGRRVFIPRIVMDIKNDDLPFELKRKQFPIRLAYSMTITKSQGQTFDKIGVYLPEPVFTHGQLYTAFSRVRSKHGLSVQIKTGSRQGVIYEGDQNIYVYNCVYRELL